MQDNQRTLRKEYIFEGKGLHSGKKVKMTLSPAPTGSGIIFLREDLGPDAVMEAVADYVTTTQRGTTMERERYGFLPQNICSRHLPGWAWTMPW